MVIDPTKELKRSLSQPHLPRRMNGMPPQLQRPQRPQLHQEVQADQTGSNGIRSQSELEMPKISISRAEAFGNAFGNGRNQVRLAASTGNHGGSNGFPSSIPMSFETLRAEIAAAAAHRKRVWGRCPRQLSVTLESSSEEEIAGRWKQMTKRGFGQLGFVWQLNGNPVNQRLVNHNHHFHIYVCVCVLKLR